MMLYVHTVEVFCNEKMGRNEQCADMFFILLIKNNADMF